MKPSERIEEIIESISVSLNPWQISYWLRDIEKEAIIIYLDEEHEKHKEDIQITQGR